MTIISLFDPPALHRCAIIPVGAVFSFGGRPLKIVRVYGDDDAAPVIVEELVAVGRALPGQYGLWSAAAVARAMTQSLNMKV